MKTHKTISLSQQVLEDVQRRTKTEGFNFSRWIEREYIARFFSLEAKQALLAKKAEEVKALDTEINELLAAPNPIYFDRDAERYLSSIYRRVAEGQEWRALLTQFNLIFHKELTFDEFKKLAGFYKGKTI